MGKLKACRICLQMDLRLENIQSNFLGLYYEIITGLNLNENELPGYFCYQCAALLKKFYSFRQKSLKGLEILQGVLETYGKITEDTMRKTEQKNSCSKSGLSTFNGFSINIFPEGVEEDTTVNEMNVSIEASHDFKNDNTALELYDLIKEEPCEKLNSDVDESYEDWLSDDEPLAVHKSIKKKIEKKKIVKEEIKEETVELPKTKTAKLKKSIKVNKKPVKLLRKDVIQPKQIQDFNFESYVDVITLTEEEQKEEISKRKESENYQSAPFKCELCFKVFLDTQTWQHHMKKHDVSSGRVQCEICKLRFKSQHCLNKHIMCHAKKYKCKYCPYISRNTTQAWNHVFWHQGVTYKCPHCDEQFSQWTSYLSHVRIKHPSDYICPHCGYSFVSQHGLNMHKSLMHRGVADLNEENKDLPFCSSCDMKFASEEAHKRHLVTAKKHILDSEKKNGCRECGEKFSSIDELRVHSRTAHTHKACDALLQRYKRNSDSRTWPTKCPHCSEEIANARQYWSHFRRNHPDEVYPVEKKYICDICGKSFRGNAFLTYHKRIHTGEKPFKCKQCDKRFFNRTNLLMHEKTHSEQRPYICCVCGKGFKSKGALDRHFRCHTGDRPYKCELCGKAFAQSNSCKVHVHTVHLKQPSPYISRARLQKRVKNLATDKQTVLYCT
ncbi:zinc finger protein 345-like [Pieris napi]|uniref:zinc finger protein 345-like n=1 Tax=Pieris napi TaxID=78633 RepID=UPI001FB8B00D|nr:zinc finger protein 345-like [Pieris napi]